MPRQIVGSAITPATSAPLGLEDFPDVLYVLRVKLVGREEHVKYGCWSHKGVHGLAAFSMPLGASGFVDYIDGVVSGEVDEVSFDRAREIAKERPLPINALFLCDDMAAPLMHEIR